MERAKIGGVRSCTDTQGYARTVPWCSAGEVQCDAAKGEGRELSLIVDFCDAGAGYDWLEQGPVVDQRSVGGMLFCRGLSEDWG